MGLVAEREEQRNGERAGRHSGQVEAEQRAAGDSADRGCNRIESTRNKQPHTLTAAARGWENGQRAEQRAAGHETDATVKIRAAETRIVTALKGSANFVGDESGRMWSEKAMSDV